MPRQLRPADADTLAVAWEVRATDRTAMRTVVKHYLALLQQRAPGNSVEVRVPPFAAVQVIPGVRHTRGTPPAVIETDAPTWVALATGELAWTDAVAQDRVRASGERTDLSAYLPLVEEVR